MFLHLFINPNLGRLLGVLLEVRGIKFYMLGLYCKRIGIFGKNNRAAAVIKLIV